MEPTAFMTALFELMRKRGTPISSAPFVEGREIDLHQFCQAVMLNGGSQNVSSFLPYTQVRSNKEY